MAFASCIPMAANPHHHAIWPAVSVHPSWLQIPDPSTSVSQVWTLQAYATKPNCPFQLCKKNHNRCVMVYHFYFCLHFPNKTQSLHKLICYLFQYPFPSFVHFESWFIYFFLLSFESSFYNLDTILYQLHVYQILVSFFE